MDALYSNLLDFILLLLGFFKFLSVFKRHTWEFYLMSEQSLTAHIYCRQKMADILIHDLHNLASEALKTMTNSRSYHILGERLIAEKASLRLGTGRSSPGLDDSSTSLTSFPFPGLSPGSSWSSSPHSQSQSSRPSTLTSESNTLSGSGRNNKA